MTLHVDNGELEKREPASEDLSSGDFGIGRELFTDFRKVVGAAEKGATIFNWE